MDEVIVGIVCIAFGVYAIVWRHSYMDEIAKYQERVFGLSQDVQNKKGGTYVLVLGGVLFVIVGVLLVFHIIHFKPS